jgi:outer membrane receptor protein involved in Fe transport
MRFLVRWLVGLLVLVGSVSLHAQTGTLQLGVRDGQAASVAASGQIESVATGVRSNFSTNAEGLVAINGLAYGGYRLTLRKEGFATQTVLVEMNGPVVSRTVTLQLGATGFSMNVVVGAVLPGVELERDQVPSPVQTANAADIEQSFSLNMADFLNRRLNGVFINDLQSNPFQPDVNYRGYTASPLLGTPQGLSIYMDGVRLNQPFGDVVSWDLIPRIAIAETTLMPGSNPLFGLNTLGGALALTTKDGYSAPGTTVSLGGGSYGRKIAEMEHGGSRGAWNWYGAMNLFFEDGWRQSSPSNVRQFFGRLGWQGTRTTIHLTFSYANNALNGNGLQEHSLLAADYTSVYTRPDINGNRSPFAIINARRAVGSNVTLSGNAYYRYIQSHSLNGDLNEGSLDQSVYQPNAAEQAALTAAGYRGFPTAGANASNTPFPFWRCIANLLRQDEPGEKCNALINRSQSKLANFGTSGQLSWALSGPRHRNRFTVGGAYDYNRADFTQSSEIGYLAPDRSVVGTGIFADGVHAGDVDGEPFDNRAELLGRTSTGSFYLTDTITLASKLSLTASGRFNRTTVNNLDQIQPDEGTGSLSGYHTFQRFNAAAGATYNVTSLVNAYFNFSEGSRAPTSIESGCADPSTPCRLPNALAGDPPLNQVVTRTLEAGIRGQSERRLNWSAGWFRASNRDDILFVASAQSGFGYFKNFGRTLRQGLELDSSVRFSIVTIGGGYTLLDATFRSQEELNGNGNSTNESGAGLDGSITITPGNRIPLIPRHMGKVYADVRPNAKVSVNVGLTAFSSSYARGNENNAHQPDGAYYTGDGTSPGYAVVNLGLRYQVFRRVEFWAQVNNFLDRKYSSGAQLGPMGFTAAGNFIARPFPAVNGDFPIRHSTFLAPGAPRGAWVGLRFRL